MTLTKRETRAQLTFTDRDAHNRYQAAFMEVFQRNSGTLLAADEAPLVIEGKWDREKVVLMAFLRRGGVSRMGGIY